MWEEELKDPLADFENLEGNETTMTPDPKEDEDNSETPKEVKEEPKDDSEEKEEKEPEKELTAKEKRHAQQKAWEEKEAIRLRNLSIEREVERATKDATSLLGLSKKDPKLAKEVAWRFTWQDTERGTYEKFLASNGEKPSLDEKTYTKAEMLEFYKEQKAKDTHEESIEEAKAIFEKLPEELQDEAIAEFNDLVEGKTLNREKALKYANMVTLALKKESKKIDATEPLKKLSSTGISNSKKVSTSNEKVMVIGLDWEELFLDPNQLK